MKKEEIVALLDMFDEFKPVIPQIIEKVRELAPMIFPLIEDLRQGTVEFRIKSIDQYIAMGKFTREEAINMTLSDMSAIRKSVETAKAKLEGIHY